MTVVIAGAGAFGGALAIALSATRSVTLLGRDPGNMARVTETRELAGRLPGMRLPANVDVTADTTCLETADTVLLCVPTQKLGGYLEAHGAALLGKNLVACCKGIDAQTLDAPVDLIARNVPDATHAILTGPSFAADIARGLPTALTLACRDAASAQRLQNDLAQPNLRLYRSTDVAGAQLGGALKNVIAIAAGTCIGAGLGESARAALMTRGFAEMQRIGQLFGAEPETLSGLSGLGDLLLTCSSEQSRNYSLGISIGAGQDFDPNITVEGAATARAVTDLASRSGVELPICTLVAALVAGEMKPARAIDALLSRPLREE